VKDVWDRLDSWERWLLVFGAFAFLNALLAIIQVSFLRLLISIVVTFVMFWLLRQSRIVRASRRVPR
jgi:hypothetical protein